MQNVVTNRVDQEEIQNERVEKVEWNKKVHGPRGIGGWLLVVFIGLLLSLLTVAIHLFNITLPALFSDSTIVRFETSYNADWTIYLTFDAVFKGGFALYCCYVIFRFLQKNPIVPRLMIILYYVNLIGVIIETCLLLTTVEAVSDNFNFSYWSIAQALAICIIWIPYFKLSDRVDNTFSDCWKS
ncbi:hypothetical protein PAECIP112173_01304 [Paenibacillus sp. JJ-100]|uniref:DUF2569 domain-containing protein n=1 Tax=Paenibacillus sp. JJ-100 TaxID=2974896 RepID=UPI0022FF6C74|nr:DUF2569 domain-containing protein [Paenibacillus sp. JJ-100]CAI6048706.1 hypothetical protein PAECIP112173_01304 [Paenibacillus sp. JJ-100]